ncbi:MAG: cysteine desulfurase [Clostridiales bacterium]|jgi:cysteine desulfurase|nr:cysteine desulfurase [Clostridiales bacterium]
MKKRIYFDHAATTPVDPAVFEAMKPYFCETFGNAANTVYSFGREAAQAVGEARAKVAKAINAGCRLLDSRQKDEVYFTSGGTEADVWALTGAAYANAAKGKHIVTTKIEHAAVMSTCAQLEKRGFEVTYVGVDARGVVRLDKLIGALRPDTVLVSVMAANNETGAIQPVEEIGKLCAERKILFHTDAVQAAGALDIDVKKWNVDMLSLSAHKFYGPKGIGALYIRKGVKIDKLISGGHQEFSQRGGTSNVPLIVGLGAAIEAAATQRETRVRHLKELKARLLSRLREIDYTSVNADPERTLPGTVSVGFGFIESEGLLTSLDLNGIAASSGSACASDSLEPSHVLLAMGLSHADAQGVLRFSFGKSNTVAEIDTCVDLLKDIVAKRREMSPLFAEFKAEKKFV